MKAKKADKPRITKAWRIKEDTFKAIVKLAGKMKMAECEVIEFAIDTINSKK